MSEDQLCPTEVGVERAISGPKPNPNWLSRKLGNVLRSSTSPFPHNSLKVIYPWREAICWWTAQKTFEVNPDRVGKIKLPHWEAETGLEFNWAQWYMPVIVEAKGMGSQVLGQPELQSETLLKEKEERSKKGF